MIYAQGCSSNNFSWSDIPLIPRRPNGWWGTKAARSPRVVHRPNALEGVRRHNTAAFVLARLVHPHLWGRAVLYGNDPCWGEVLWVEGALWPRRRGRGPHSHQRAVHPPDVPGPIVEVVFALDLCVDYCKERLCGGVMRCGSRAYGGPDCGYL